MYSKCSHDNRYLVFISLNRSLRCDIISMTDIVWLHCSEYVLVSKCCRISQSVFRQPLKSFSKTFKSTRVAFTVIGSSSFSLLSSQLFGFPLDDFRLIHFSLMILYLSFQILHLQHHNLTKN